MIEPGENLAFAAKATDHRVALEIDPDELDSDLLAELIVAPGSQVDRSHPASSELAHQLVRPKLPPDRRFTDDRFNDYGCRFAGRLKKSVGICLRRDKRLDFNAERFVSSRRFFDELTSLLRRQLDRFLKDLFDQPPALWINLASRGDVSSFDAGGVEIDFFHNFRNSKRTE